MRHIKEIQRAFEEDEYDDQYQAEVLYDDIVGGGDILLDFFKRNVKGNRILDIGCGSGSLFEEFNITHAIEPNERRLTQAKLSKCAPDVNIKYGWLEDTGYELGNYFNTVLSWGVMCFVRSMMEALIEINRILKIGGVFIFDINTTSNLPIAQTVHLSSFLNFIKTFGFSTIEYREFGDEYHKRVAIAALKEREFDPNYLKIPFLKKDGTVGNFLLERDWYLV